VIVSDSESETSYSWTLTAGSLSQYTCSQVSGHICTEKQTCSSSFLGVYDAHRCCQTTCIPVFKDAQKCSSINSSLKVTIESPGNEEEFSVGDTINVDVKVSNELSKDQNLEISAELYDTTDENSIADNSVDLDLAEGDSDTVTINLEVPEADDSHDYVIFVRAKDNACNQAYIPVKIVLPEHKLEINKIDSFDEAVCGDVLDFKVNVLNLGSNDETAYIKVTNSKLKISEVSDEFDIERLGDDDSISKTLEVTIPDNAGAGNYTFAISAISEDAESSSAKSIILGECSKPVSKKTVSTRIELNSTTSSSEQQAEKTDKSVFIVGIIVFVMIIASISIISYALFKKRKSKNYSSQIY